MNNPTPNITIPVDLTNPGQFFACCGLLELADRLWPGAHGWFETGGSQFYMVADGSLPETVAAFSASDIKWVNQTTVSPLLLTLRGKVAMRLDWWLDEVSGGSRLKTWAGRQSGPEIFELLVRKAAGAPAPDILNFAVPVYGAAKDGKLKTKTISPFYFDARRAGTALDAGFSADEQGMSFAEYVAVESLAMVGLQRFRPARSESCFLYTAWPHPLPPLAASAVASGHVPVPGSQNFRFSTPSRGGDYVKMFTCAMRERTDNVRN